MVSAAIMGVSDTALLLRGAFSRYISQVQGPPAPRQGCRKSLQINRNSNMDAVIVQGQSSVGNNGQWDMIGEGIWGGRGGGLVITV